MCRPVKTFTSVCVCCLTNSKANESTKEQSTIHHKSLFFSLLGTDKSALLPHGCFIFIWEPA